MNLGANLLTTDTTINLSNNGVQVFTSQVPLPTLIEIRRTSDGAVEYARLVRQISGATGTIVRAQLGTVALAFTTADTATLVPAKINNSIVSYPPGSPALGTTAAVLAATALTGAPQTITVAITNPDVPRSTTITGNAGGIAGNVIVTGTNINGSAISETIALSGSSTVNGNRAFSTITSIGLPVQTHGGTDTVKIGLGAKLGLDAVVTRDVVIKAFLNNIPEASAWAVAVGTDVSALNATPVIIDRYSS